MAEYEKTPEPDGLGELLKEIRKTGAHGQKEALRSLARDTMPFLCEKKDYDSAIDCLELVLEHGEDVDRLLAVHSMGAALRGSSAYSSKASGPSFRPFGKQKQRLNAMNEQKEKLAENAVSGLLINLLQAVVTAAMLWLIWCFPPVTNFLNAHLWKFGLALLVLYVLPNVLMVFARPVVGLVVLFAGVVFFGAVILLGRLLVPEGVRSPLAVSVLVVLPLNIKLPGSFWRNFSAAVGAPWYRAAHKRYCENLDAVLSVCSRMEDGIAHCWRTLEEDGGELLTEYLDAASGRAEGQADEAGDELKHDLTLMKQYYEYIKEQALKE